MKNIDTKNTARNTTEEVIISNKGGSTLTIQQIISESYNTECSLHHGSVGAICY